MLVFDFWVIRVSFSFCGHRIDTYRTVVYERGAFELCLPSLGILYQNSMLRSPILGHTPKTKRTRGEEAWVSHRAQDRADAALQHYVLVTVLVIQSI